MISGGDRTWSVQDSSLCPAKTAWIQELCGYFLMIQTQKCLSAYGGQVMANFGFVPKLVSLVLTFRQDDEKVRPIPLELAAYNNLFVNRLSHCRKSHESPHFLTFVLFIQILEGER